jgi:hypothetical protein
MSSRISFRAPAVASPREAAATVASSEKVVRPAPPSIVAIARMAVAPGIFKSMPSEQRARVFGSDAGETCGNDDNDEI